jgi:hypothetical protein
LFVISDNIDAIEETIRDCSNRTILSFKDIPDYILVRNQSLLFIYPSPLLIFKGIWKMSDVFQSSKEFKMKSFKAFLMEVTIAKYANIFLGTGSSGVWQLINVFRAQRLTFTLDK